MLYTDPKGREFLIDRYLDTYTGKYNLYICKAGHHNLSLDIDEGVTPMFLVCRFKIKHRRICGQQAHSSMYRLTPSQVQSFRPVKIIWREPSPRELRVASPAMLEHYQKGGLHLEWIN